MKHTWEEIIADTIERIFINGLRAKNNKVEDLSFCWRDKDGCPIFLDQDMGRYDRSGFYAAGDMEEGLSPIGIAIDFLKMSDESEREVLRILTEKYATKGS